MLAHEKLIVYQRSIELVAWVGPVIESISVKLAVKAPQGEGEVL